MTKRGRRRGEPAPCRGAGRCAGAENRRPARGEPSAYRFAALPACGGAREGRCNPFCARVAILVPEEIAAAGATSGGRGAGGWRRRAQGSAHPPAGAGEEVVRGRGNVSAAAAGPAAGFRGAGHKHEGDCHTPQPRQRLGKEGLRLSEGRMQGEIRQGNQEKAMKALAACT